MFAFSIFVSVVSFVSHSRFKITCTKAAFFSETFDSLGLGSWDLRFRSPRKRGRKFDHRDGNSTRGRFPGRIWKFGNPKSHKSGNPKLRAGVRTVHGALRGQMAASLSCFDLLDSGSPGRRFSNWSFFPSALPRHTYFSSALLCQPTSPQVSKP